MLPQKFMAIYQQIFIREMLTSALGALVKKIKMETLHWE